MQLLTRKNIKILSLILAWYILSTTLSLFNKQTVGKEAGLFGNEAFPAPLLMSSIQFSCQTILAKLVFMAGWAQRTITPRRMPWSDYFRLIVPNGAITGLDIGFSNKSLVFINLSFYTMCKATVPVFLLFFAFVWGIEKPNVELIGVVVVIVAGLVLLVAGETQFHLLGFGLVMTASCLSGLRFTLTQVLLHGHHTSAALGGPLEVLELLTPVMSVTALLFSLAWEELWVVLPGSVYFSSLWHTSLTLVAIALGGVIAFLMVWTEYQVIKETSALTFMIAGTVKEVVTVIAAVLVMGDKLTWINGLGLFIVILGVLLFNYYKYRKLKATPAASPSRRRTKQGDGSVPYTAVEATEDVHGPDGEAKPLRRLHSGSSGGGASNGTGSMPTPVSASAAVTATAASSASTFPFTGGNSSYGSYHGGQGLLSRALAGLFPRVAVATGGGGGSLELAPLLSMSTVTSGGETEARDLPPGYRSLPVINTSRDSMRDREMDRGADVEGCIIGMGNAGDHPVSAVALSGAGMSGPQRATRPGSRGLLAATVEIVGEGGSSAAAPSQASVSAAQLPQQASSPNR